MSRESRLIQARCASLSSVVENEPLESGGELQVSNDAASAAIIRSAIA